MSELIITEEKLYIKEIVSVVRSTLQFSRKCPYPNGRHSDSFVYITEGSCNYSFEGGYSFKVNKGDIIFLSHNSVYTMEILTNRYSSIFCDFYFDSPIQRKCQVFTPVQSLNAENVFERLYRLYRSPSAANFCEILSVLYNIYGIVKKSSDKSTKKSLSKLVIENAKDYIDEHYSDINLSVSNLAEMCNISEAHFRNLFKTYYDISPSSYITTVRINAACELMKYPFIPLEECATQSGFTSLPYFCRVFKKVHFVSPAKYRKEKFF
ncbi:MAG: AraC family transcriptional regulator [Acutalibacteraceae bacterium]|nr:AraC family transcriptional regulator [Acutalibacteraceae bacterium]